MLPFGAAAGAASTQRPNAPRSAAGTDASARYLVPGLLLPESGTNFRAWTARSRRIVENTLYLYKTLGM